MKTKKENFENACITLIDTYNNCGITREDYDETVDQECNDYYSWLEEQVNEETENFFDDLEWSKVDYPLMITGELDLWNGKPDIVPIKIESDEFVTYYINHKGERVLYHKGHYKQPSLLIAIKKCISENSILDFKVRFNDGIIEVDAMHHDGTNRFYIRKLSVKGIKRAESFDKRYENYKPKDYWFNRIKYNEIF